MAKGERGRAPTVLLPKEKEAVTRSRTQEDDGFECVSFYSFKNKQYIDGSRKKFPNQRFLRNTKQIVSVEKYQQLPPATPTYTGIRTGASMKPEKKYCDLTGLKANYIDPRTRIRFHNKDLFSPIHHQSKDHHNAFLAVRGASKKM